LRLYRVIKRLIDFFIVITLDLGNGKIGITSISQIKNLLKDF